MKKVLFLLAACAVLFAACSEKGGETTPPPVETTLSVSPATLDFPHEGATQKITITTNAEWEIQLTPSDVSDWLELSKMSGEAGTIEVDVTAEANLGSEELSALIKVKAGDLTKNVTVSQGFYQAPPAPPVTDNSNYTITGSQLKYADDLQDGGLYVVCNQYSSGKFWTVENNKLTMTDHSTADQFSSANVFEYKYDESKIDKGLDSYYNWSAGAWKSLSTGLYIDEAFNADAELASALYIVSANNWGGGEGNEVNVFDMYHSKSKAGDPYALWYLDGSFTFGNMELGYNSPGNTGNRKYLVYKVAKVE